MTPPFVLVGFGEGIEGSRGKRVGAGGHGREQEVPFQIHVSLQNSGQELGTTGKGRPGRGAAAWAVRAWAVRAVWAVVEGGAMRQTSWAFTKPSEHEGGDKHPNPMSMKGGHMRPPTFNPQPFPLALLYPTTPFLPPYDCFLMAPSADPPPFSLNQPSAALAASAADPVGKPTSGSKQVQY